MQPVRWVNIKWWILLFASEGTEYTSWYQVFHTTSSYYQSWIQIEATPQNKFLRVKLDTCADVNIMPVSVYKLVFQNQDCEKLVSSSKLEISTYITNKIKVIWSCILFAVHPDTQCLQEVKFYVTSHEGSVVLSCATTFALSLIQPPNSADHLAKGTRLISGSADHPMKIKSQMNVQVLKPCDTVCTCKEQSPAMCLKVVPPHDSHVGQCDQDNTRKQWYWVTDTSLYVDKNCQPTQCEHMQPVELARKQFQSYAVSETSNAARKSYVTSKSDRSI